MQDYAPRYTLGSNIMYALRIYWSSKKSTLICCAADAVLSVLLPFVRILLPKLVIDELMAGATPTHFISVVGGASLLIIILSYAKGYTDTITTRSVGIVACLEYIAKGWLLGTTRDYELLEDPEILVLQDRAFRALQNGAQSPVNSVPRILSRLIANVLGLLLYGGVIARIHPAVLVLLAASAAINWSSLTSARKYESQTQAERSRLYKKLYYIRRSVRTPAKAKDVRLYGMSRWMEQVFAKITRDYETAQHKVATRDMVARLVDSSLVLVRDGAAYAYLTYLLLRGNLALGDFVLAFAAIGAFASWVSGIILQSSELLRFSAEQSDFRAFVDFPDRSNTGPGVALPVGAALPPSISLEDVSYTYPNATSEGLRNISLCIRPGERIAIVGENGAGKTTLIKLICGLCRPQTGCVSLAGVDIKKYNRDEYFTLFSTVFQDIHLQVVDVAGNVSQATPEATDDERVVECLKLAGLYERVAAMPQKERTLLVPQINEDAVELSGGEKQKLALARALYKNAPVLILDEPTAALDPIAESEIYAKYAELTRGKTSIYISHRLASTRFCDRILFLADHTIAEIGSHDELMRLGGRYAEMFDIQSQYYKQHEEVGS